MAEVLADAVRLSAWTLKGNDLSKEALFFANQLGTSFKVFATRIAEHAQYEDQCLFPFFVELLPDFKALGGALTLQHQEMDAMEVDIIDSISVLHTALEAPDATQAGVAAPRLLGAYREYHQLILEHLSSEESSIIGPWLHLTPAQYQHYVDKYLAPHGHSPSTIPLLSGTDDDGKMADKEVGEKQEKVETKKVEATKKEQEDEDRRREESKRQEEARVQRARQEEQQRRETERKEKEERQKQQSREQPKLYDRHGREVDLRSPGCCFDGVDGCCKGSAYQRLLQRMGYVVDPKTGTYVLKK